MANAFVTSRASQPKGSFYIDAKLQALSYTLYPNCKWQKASWIEGFAMWFDTFGPWDGIG